MCCEKFWQRIVPFALAFIFGFLAVNLLHKETTENKNQGNLKSKNKIFCSRTGTGQSGADTGKILETPVKDKSSTVSETKPIQIISKPKPTYTGEARENQVQGTVTLRVTFTASGEIGSISTVNSLPYGLTEQAISAARGIRFEPAEKNGIPQTVTKQVQYNFTIY